MITVNTNQANASITQLSSQLSHSAITSAMSRSINRTITHERKVSRMDVKKRYNMPGDVANAFKTFTANPRQLTGKLAANKKQIPLHRFNPTFNNGSYSARVTRSKGNSSSKVGKGNKQAGGVSFEVIRGQKKNLPFAFILKNGKVPVFARGAYGTSGFVTSKKRLPVAKIVTLSLYQAVAGQVPRVKLNADSKAFYNKTFLSELKYQVGRATHNP